MNEDPSAGAETGDRGADNGASGDQPDQGRAGEADAEAGCAGGDSSSCWERLRWVDDFCKRLHRAKRGFKGKPWIDPDTWEKDNNQPGPWPPPRNGDEAREYLGEGIPEFGEQDEGGEGDGAPQGWSDIDWHEGAGAVRGVLLSDKIAQLCDGDEPLIAPYDPDCLKPASYRLRVGHRYVPAGDDASGEDSMSVLAPGEKIEIPPFNVVVVKTLERLHMPYFLVGRPSIRLSLAHKGLLWVAGPHVSPGYIGHLYCAVYNFSDRGQELSYGDPLGPIEFVTTTDPEAAREYWQANESQPEDVYHEGGGLPTASWLGHEEYTDARSLRSGVAAEVSGRLDSMEETVHSVRRNLLTITGVFFTALSILALAFAALATARDVPDIVGPDALGWGPFTWLVIFIVPLLLLMVFLFVKAIWTTFSKD